MTASSEEQEAHLEVVIVEFAGLEEALPALTDCEIAILFQ